MNASVTKRTGRSGEIDAVMLWNEPDNASHRGAPLDPPFEPERPRFAALAGAALAGAVPEGA